MNNIKVTAYKKILKEVAQKYDGAEDFIKKKNLWNCSEEMLSAEKAQ